MGMQCELNEIFHFTYKADVTQGLIEHEIDHVFVGTTDDTPEINPEEVASWKYDTMENISMDIEKNPQEYTPWFKIAFAELLKHYNK
jgi:isopentenyl-diphosphate delta-isomerase